VASQPGLLATLICAVSGTFVKSRAIRVTVGPQFTVVMVTERRSHPRIEKDGERRQGDGERVRTREYPEFDESMTTIR